MFERGIGEFDARARLGPHFADSRGEAARATIRNRVIELTVAGLHNHVRDLLLGNRCADLDRAPRLRIKLAAHLARRERCAMHTVASCAATERHYLVPRLDRAWMTSLRQDTQAAAVDQRVINITGVIKDGPVHSGNAHLVAIIADAIDHAIGNALRRKDAGSQLVHRCVGRAEAEYIGTGNRLSRDAKYVTNDAAHPRIGPAKRLYGRRMVMRLHLEREIVRGGKANDASVIAKGRDQPGRPDLFGCAHNIAFEQAINLLCLKLVAIAIQLAIVDGCLERLMRAMFRPGLSHRLYL